MEQEPYRAPAEAPVDVEIELLVVQRRLGLRIVLFGVFLAVVAFLASTTVLYVYFAEQLALRRGLEWPKGVGMAALGCSAAWIAVVAQLFRRFVLPRYRRRVLVGWCEQHGVDTAGLDHLLY